MKRRTDGDSWNQWFDLRMREIDQNWKREMICALLCLPLLAVVAWLILAVG